MLHLTSHFTDPIDPRVVKSEGPKLIIYSDWIDWAGIGVAMATTKVGGPNNVRLNKEKSSRSTAQIHCDHGEIAIFLGDNIKFKVIMS